MLQYPNKSYDIIYFNICLTAQYISYIYLLLLQSELLFSEIDYMQKRVRNKSN